MRAPADRPAPNGSLLAGAPAATRGPYADYSPADGVRTGAVLGSALLLACVYALVRARCGARRARHAHAVKLSSADRSAAAMRRISVQLRERRLSRAAPAAPFPPAARRSTVAAVWSHPGRERLERARAWVLDHSAGAGAPDRLGVDLAARRPTFHAVLLDAPAPRHARSRSLAPPGAHGLPLV